MTKFYRPPPQDAGLIDLIDFVVHHGLGLGHGDESQALVGHWENADLSEALTDLGFTVSEKSIENWRSGKHVPNPNYLRGLALLVTNTKDEQTLWREALFAARSLATKQKHAASALTDTTDADGASDRPDHSPSPHVASGRRNRPTLTVAAIFLGLFLTIGLIFFNQSQGQSELPSIGDFMVCDKANFNESTLLCTRNISHFPAGTAKIYTSFTLENVARGAKFERIWFRCGRRFASRESRNVAPWEGWTWTEADDLEEAGPFSLNVIVGDVVAVSEFTIGNQDKVNCLDF